VTNKVFVVVFALLQTVFACEPGWSQSSSVSKPAPSNKPRYNADSFRFPGTNQKAVTTTGGSPLDKPPPKAEKKHEGPVDPNNSGGAQQHEE
jgi:hypothetical protein